MPPQPKEQPEAARPKLQMALERNPRTVAGGRPFARPIPIAVAALCSALCVAAGLGISEKQGSHIANIDHGFGSSQTVNPSAESPADKAQNDSSFGGLSVAMTNLSPAVVQRFHLQTRLGGGLFVRRVGLNSTAEKAGILRGDIISAIDGVPLSDWRELAAKLKFSQPGEIVTLSLERVGKSKTVAVAVEPNRIFHEIPDALLPP